MNRCKEFITRLQVLIQAYVRFYILGHVAEQLELKQLGTQTMTHLLFGDTKMART